MESTLRVFRPVETHTESQPNVFELIRLNLAQMTEDAAKIVEAMDVAMCVQECSTRGAKVDCHDQRWAV